MAVDLNHDGKPDLVVANSDDGTVSVLFNGGNGAFQPKKTYPAGKRPLSVAALDPNGDGEPDLVVANNVDDTVSVLLNQGDGALCCRRPRSFTPRATPRIRSWRRT